jgi:hypothetical protein
MYKESCGERKCKTLADLAEKLKQTIQHNHSCNETLFHEQLKSNVQRNLSFKLRGVLKQGIVELISTPLQGVWSLDEIAAIAGALKHDAVLQMYFLRSHVLGGSKLLDLKMITLMNVEKFASEFSSLVGDVQLYLIRHLQSKRDNTTQENKEEKELTQEEKLQYELACRGISNRYPRQWNVVMEHFRYFNVSQAIINVIQQSRLTKWSE